MKRDDERMEERGEERAPHRRWKRVAGMALVAVALLAAGVTGGAIWAERRAASDAGRSKINPAGTASGEKAGPGDQGGSMPFMPGMVGTQSGPQREAQVEEPVEVSLTTDAAERAGIKIVEVRSQAAAGAIAVPATVMSNAYRDTKVNALVGGVVRQVLVELGATVERGQPLAVIFSAELAEAQMKYLSMRALLQADQQKLHRTRQLVDLGAASRQELEEVTATHTARETELAAARQRLLLLGLSPGQAAKLENASQVVSDVVVPSPASGSVITRAVNPGQVVGAGQELFVVTDLSSVWVIGDLYEKDFPAVRVGSLGTVTVPSAPNAPLRGRVAYIDPRVEPSTRTAKVRVEVPNRNGDLRLGMFVTVSFETGAGQRRAVVPRGAVQAVGPRTVVYVPVDGEDSKFVERPVKLGQLGGDLAEVLEGLKPGEKVVTDGSFFLRAEAAKSRSGG